MATLLKLQLCGIRSFGPTELQQISFDTPVTLLVGQNGCGKTTILEAIKYVCTGELPGGTTKGQGFVHDPKILNRALVKGQVRLRLVDVKGDTYLITKSVQLQLKANGLSFSSLDSAISILRPGEDPQQITGRCVDIEKYCTQILQVSPCILNNVLFCHQENSSWPLEEGKKVKEKFDEIFDSKKYNKCGEMLGKYLKTKQDSIKLIKQGVENKKEKRDDTLKKRQKLQQKKEQCDSITENIRNKTESLNPHKIRLEEIRLLEEDLSNLQRTLSSKMAEKKGIIQQQNMLRENISLFEGTDNELNNEVLLFEQKQTEKKAAIKTSEEQKTVFEKKENRADAEIQKTQIKLGQLRGEKKQYEMKCVEQNSLFEKAVTYMNVSDSITWHTPEDSEKAINMLKSKLYDVDQNVESIIKAKNEEESILQGRIDKVRETLATTKEKVQTISIDMKKNEEKVLHITNEIQELDVANNKLLEINKKIEECTRNLSKLQNKFSEELAESEIEHTKNEIAQTEKKLEALEKLYKILQHNYILDEKLNGEEQLRIKKRTESNKIKNKHSIHFKHIFGDLPDDNIGKRVQAVLNAAENDMKKINTEITLKQKEVTKLETQIQHQTKSIKQYEEELKLKKNEIESVCQGKDFASLLTETFDRKEKLQRDKGQYSSGKIMYEKFIEVFEGEKPCCPICDTDFSNKSVKGVLDKMKQTMKAIPEKLMNSEKNLKKEEQLYNKLQQLKPVNESIVLLSNVKLPLLNEQLENDKNDLTKLNSVLSKLYEDMQIPTENVEICRKIIADATLLDQYHTDIKICNEKINDFQNEKKKIETTKSKHEVESEIENLKADLSNQRKQYETVRYKLDQHKQRCQSIKEDKSKQMELQLKYQTLANNKPHLEKQLNELKDDYSVLLIEHEEQQSEYKTSDQELRKLCKDKNNLVESNKKIINVERTEAHKKHKLVEAILATNCEIIAYQNKNVEGNLEQIIHLITQLEEKKKDFSALKNKEVDRITEQKEEIAKQATDLRNLRDNITLREKLKQESLLVLEITNLEKRIGNYNYHTVHEEKVKLQRQVQTTEREINNLKGQEMELKNTISDIDQDLNLPENRNVERNYREKLYELKLAEKVVYDLKIYVKALHNSILQFHKERMLQINDRIRELWRNIYRGNDIDYIQINAEESKVNTSRQTYDYKVVQIKNGVELEMRGRCSAGQRVLACLIVRMALAESFSSHCGILALDEPTTNLDKENIISLTHALSNIIMAHEHDNNFQLIVITHDQDFLDILRHNVQNISHYWKVSRDPRGYSVINKTRL